jgi:phosphate-selective porin OprO/OprP
MSRVNVRRRFQQAALGFAVWFWAQAVAMGQQLPSPRELPPYPYTEPVQTAPLAPGHLVDEQPGLPATVKPREAASGDQPIDRKLIEAIVDARVKEKLKEEADKKKAAEEQKETEKTTKLAQEGYRIGSDMRMTASLRDGLFLWLDTPNKDFTMHIGGWFQVDNVFWDQSAALRAPPDGRPGKKQGVASGAALGGIGNLEDGAYFRRIRPFVEGALWENFEYRLILALENNQFSTAGLDEFWIAANNIPLIGTLRIGHVKTPMGFEADMTGSSRTMTFMERSSYSDAIEQSENFVTGVWLSNNYLDERTTWTFSAFRQDNAASSGAFFGDGQWGWQGRLTALPLYEAEGRHFLHLGLSGGWRNGASNAASTFRQFQLRARPELRDDVPAGAVAGVPDANSNRMIDTGVMAASRDWLTGLEFFYVLGPFSLQAEYGWSMIDDVVGFAPAGFKLNPKLATAQNYMFNGGYIQLAYTLTGESRGYDKKYGILSRDYFGGRGPFTNAWLLWDENHRLNWGIGAWEVAARYSYTNLNNGTGLNRIQGGVMDGVSLGLNWYLNNNVKAQFDWAYDRREDLAGSVPGFTSGFGMRVQLSF